uniref:L1 transposable element RRM domain-containing protein n=1 Tax=Equus caballus TaxID=9796 RepID=A0A9L0SBQ6_HORSE
MRRQRNMFQAREQDKTPEKELNETETNNLPDKKFKQNSIRMLTDLGRKLDEHSENANKELENIKKNQSEMKNTILEMKNSLEGLNSRVRLEEITQAEQIKEKTIKKKDSLRDLWGNIKHTNSCIIGIPEEDRDKRAENQFEEMIAENFPNLKKETDIQVQEAQGTSNKINPKRPTPRIL